MKTLSNFIDSNSNKSFEQLVNESLENNTRIINEDQLLIEHGKDIDSVIYKFKLYTSNSLYHSNRFNESADSYLFTPAESLTARDMLIYACENYRDSLLEELNIYEELLADDSLIIEGKFTDKVKNVSKNIVQNVKATWELGTEKVKEVVNTIKTKIQALTELIKKYALKAITSVKAMAAELVVLLEKLNCTLKELFSKIEGYNEDDEENDEEIETIGKELASDIDKVTKEDIYESLGIELLNLITEDDNSTTVKQVDKKAKRKEIKKLILKGLKQLGVWACVCVVIPGIVCAIFPGTFIALLVPLVCKLIWSGVKIYKIYKEWKKIKEEWPRYSKAKKIFTVVMMCWSIVTIILNIGSLANQAGPVVKALTSTSKGLLDKANLGISPDFLTKACAACFKNIMEGKWPWDNFGQAFKEISDSFAQELPVPKIITQVGHVGQDPQKVLGDIANKTYKSSMQPLREICKQSISADKLPQNGTVSIIVNGSIDSSYGQQLVKDYGVKATSKVLNKSLNSINKLAGAVYAIDVPAADAQEILANSAKYAKHGLMYAIGATSETMSITFDTVTTAATDMLMTIPSVEVAPTGDYHGFNVRLGDKKTKNYIYYIDKDGVKIEKVSKYQDKYDSIKQYVHDVNAQYIKNLQDAAKDDEEKKKIEDASKEFENNYKNGINNLNCVVFYGTLLNEKEQKQYNESLSLHDYIISEAEEKKQKYDISTINDNFTDLRKYLDKIGINNNSVSNKDDKDAKSKGKNSYLGNNQMLLKAFFSRSEKAETRNFTWDDGKMKKGKEETDKYVPISVRSGNKIPDDNHFYAQDIEYISALFAKWLDDTDNGYKNFRQAFIDILILKNNFINKPDYKVIVGAYCRMIDALLKIKHISSEVKDREWTKLGDPWAPLKFDESDIDDKTTEQVKETEKKVMDKTSDSEEDALQQTPLETSTTTTAPEESEDDEEDKDEDGLVPVLMFANAYGMDIAKANPKGPRKDPYSLKGAFNSLEFIERKDGIKLKDIQQMLANFLWAQTNQLYNLSAYKPCIKEKGSDKYEITDYAKNDKEERTDFGHLTNVDITDILNRSEKDDNVLKYIVDKTSITAAETEDEKQQVEKEKETIVDRTLKAAEKDDEKGKNVKDALKAIDKDLIDKNGKVNKTKLDKYADTLANYNMARYKKKEKKGLWQRIVDAFKKFFTGKDDERRYKRWNSYLRESLNESQYDGIEYDDNPAYDIFEENTPRNISLKDYIKESLR